VPEMTLRLLRTPALLAVSAVALTACGGGGDSDSDATPTPAPSETSTVDVPEGVEITPEGAQLAFGEGATVAHEIKNTEAVLGLTVESAAQGSISDFSGFNLDDPYRKNANYYYVRVAVENSGEEATGGIDVPLWGISGENTLLPIVKFTSAFKKCPTEQIPKKLKPGAEFKTCLVYLSPDKGELDGVSYRPTEEYVPIEWRGKVTMLPEKKKQTTKD